MKNTILAIPQHNKVYVIKKRALTEMKIGSGRGQAKLWDSFKRCTEGVNSTHDIAAAENKIKKILSFDTPSYEIACKDITFLSKVGMTSIPEGKKNDWNSIVRLMGTFLRKMGYLRNINTHQEERLIGSTVDNAYAKRPFRPIGIVNLELKLHPESARHGLIAVKDARDIQVCGMAFTRMYGLGTLPVYTAVAYERLDEFGNTVRDPRPIDTKKLGDVLKNYPLERAIEECVITDFKKSEDFPNRRD